MGLVSFMEIVSVSKNLMLGFEALKLDLYNSSYSPFSGTATGCPILTPYTVQILGLIFGWEKEGIWTRVLHGNYSCICKIYVGF